MSKEREKEKELFIFGISEKDGWFFTPQFNVYQKVNKDVYCYVSRYLGFYTIQLYERGTISLCTLEARCEYDIERLFSIGERWLKDYETLDVEAIKENPYHISQPNLKEVFWLDKNE